jgi:hypothetical protein
MKVELTAVIKEIGIIESFGDSGFQKRNVILTEQSGQYENVYCFEFSKDKLNDPERYQVGQTVKIGGFVSCRQWQDKFFTSLRASFIQNAGEQPQQAPQAEFGQAGYAQPQVPVQQSAQYAQQPVQNVAPQNVAQPATQPVFPNQQPASMAPPAHQPNLGQAPNGEDIPF